MPRFLIERNFAEQLVITKDDAEQVRKINDDEGVKWLFSFLSPDKRKTYCLYEAPSAEAIRALAWLPDPRGLPAILEVVRNERGFFLASTRRAAILGRPARWSPTRRRST